MARGRGRGRGASRAARFSSRPQSPMVKRDDSDEDMAEADVDDTRDATPQDGEEGGGEGEGEGGGDGEDAATPVLDDDVPGVDDDDDDDAPVIQSIPRRRGRAGRPRLSRPNINTPEPGGDDGDESGTPGRRRRGRPSGWRGGFRGRRSNVVAQATRVPIDKEGNMMDVVDDEVALPEDDEGETKVDKNGHLQGGRDYRVRVFTIQDRGERLYMLSTEPARCTGFRDSYLFFTKHLSLFKIIVDENEKKDLISRDIIPHSYKGRSIGVVTARSVFREFGARIVIGGRKVTDDYHVEAAREDGVAKGELADPHDRLPAPGEPYNKNQYVAWHGASQVYHTNLPSVPLPTGKPVTSKRKNNVTAINWQFEHAREASKFNISLTAMRRANIDGVYDAHTNLMFYPKIMQPSHIKWEQIPTPSELFNAQKLANGTHVNGHLTNGHSDGDAEHPNSQDVADESMFEPVPQIVARNFLVTDTYFQTPPVSNLGVPGPDGDVDDLGSNGLSNIPAHVLDELPDECRAAFEDARKIEMEWKGRWSTEEDHGARGKLRIGFNGFPV